jgi:hypothetical protein
LLGSVAGALIHFLEEAQVGVERAQLGVVVHILDVDRLLRQRDVAGDGMLGNRQLEVLEGIQAGLDLGHDGLLILAHRVNGEAVGVEQGADVGAHLQHDFVDVVGGVDLVRYRLQLLLEREARTDVGMRPCVGTQHCAHWNPPCRLLLARCPMVALHTLIFNAFFPVIHSFPRFAIRLPAATP